jgi:N-formylglutamate deformylase
LRGTEACLPVRVLRYEEDDVQAYEIREPATEPVPLLVSIPHTGTYVPDDIRATFASDYVASLPMTDWHLHHLYDFLPALGVTTIYATYSRFVADLNRAPASEPLYPGRFETGLVATETFWGDPIYSTNPGPAAVEARRRLVHAPYHEQLQALIDRLRERFGRIVLIDAHSVASRASKLHGELEDAIYLGNRDGATCTPALMEAVEARFVEAGWTVARNAPYKGGYITSHYGAQAGVDALQIEMCQRMYMDEEHPETALADPRFARARTVLEAVLGTAIAVARDRSHEDG